MPRRRKVERRETGAAEAGRAAARRRRAGLPDPGAVVSEVEFTSPAGGRYRILRTDETDAYEDTASCTGETERATGRSRQGRP
jgi:hypothetical protein